MDKILCKIIGFGVSALILDVSISMTGLSGTAATTAALNHIGPDGIMGGFVALVIIGITVSVLVYDGYVALIKFVVEDMYKSGMSKEALKAKIQSSSFSDKLKVQTILYLKKL